MSWWGIRAAAVAIAAAAALGATATAAGAIETKDVGLEPVATRAEGGRQSLRIAVRPGADAEDRVRVWNKTDRPLTVDLTAVAATRKADGSVALGGDGEAASWIRIEPSRVTLPAGGERIVSVEVDVPRALPGRETTAAVMVQPALPGEDAPAVLERVAIMTYLTATSLSAPAEAGTPWSWWLGLIALIAVVSSTVKAAHRMQATRTLATARS